ncbi:DUF262 domain-containing protein [Nocardioides sp. YIM 152315]|uniref:DUF262 domain-containing protein n=1 Tax=Nocardioides sp. YIM 152315 TaxID=3031760 RepID=UPI0023DA7388|nr:DUF262 domain-containing protein [Nocardioides sp. YIM 152315]MDF1605902.1 DUF262 domain-containing protein [Nocardioides sp. YIM 152315]
MTSSEAGAEDFVEVEVDDESIEDDEGLYEMGESSLTYLGADLDVRGLVRRLEDRDIFVPRFDPDESDGSTIAGFQRQKVWNKPRMERFIESLLLGWPVPSIFLVLDVDQRYLVLDGQQRLTALQAFYDGLYPDGTPFVLNDVAEHLKGATYETLKPESRRRLDNTFIQATIIEPKGEDGPDSVYRLFGRLNSGGMILTPQEVRVALFRGAVQDFIRKLNHDENWRRLFGALHPRLKDHELILRALALRDVVETLDGDWTNTDLRRDAYRPPMSDFLNSYLQRNRELKGKPAKALELAFKAATHALFAADGADALRYDGRLNAAHVDATLASLMWLSQQDALPATTSLRRNLGTLRKSKTYGPLVTQSTSHRESVFGRLEEARRTLGRK